MVKKDLEYYMKLPYTITLKPGANVDEKYWIARVLELPHCMTHGSTPEEAIQDIEDAKREWLESNIKDSNPIPEPATYSGQFHVRMSPSLHESLSRMADIEGVSLNQFIVMALSRTAGRIEGSNTDKIDSIRAIMKDAGMSWSIGKGSGQDRSIDAAKSALDSFPKDIYINEASIILFNILGSNTLNLFEVNKAVDVIKDAINPDSDVFFSIANDPALEDEVRITLIAIGLKSDTHVISLLGEQIGTSKKLNTINLGEKTNIPKKQFLWS